MKFKVKFIASILIVSTLLSLVPWQVMDLYAAEPSTGELSEEKDISPENEGDMISDPLDDPQYANLAASNQNQGSDLLMQEFKKDFVEDVNSGVGSAAYTDTYYPTNKIILNATDQVDIDQYFVLQSALPDLRTDFTEFSALTGKSIEELTEMSSSDPTKFSSLISDTMKTKFTNDYIRSRILTNMDLLAKLLNMSSASQAINELQNNRYNVIASIDNAIAYKIDTKVIETLNYLVRPKNDPRGGAGHWRIRVARLRKNYSRDNTKYSRESSEVIAANKKATSSPSTASSTTLGEIQTNESTTDLETEAQAIGVDPANTVVSGEVQDQNGQTVSDFLVNTSEIKTNVSSHFKGQAVDIDQVDSIKCTKIERKRIGSDKKTALQPYNIKLAWQTSEGFSSDSSDINSSFNALMWNQSQQGMLNMLSGLNIDFNNIGNLNSANFSDLATIVGQAFFAQALNSPEGNIWNFPLEDTLRKLGGVLLADKLNLDRGPFLDTNFQSVDGLTEAIGRAAIEKKLSLPYGSLKGSSRDQMLINNGKYRLLTEMHLPTDILDQPATDQEDLLQKIGSRVIETGLGLNKGSFYKKNSLQEMKDAAGKYKIEAILNFPSDLDSQFNLPTNTGKNLKSGTISVAEFNRRVATAALLVTSYNYSDYSSSADSSQTPTSLGTINYRDEMFNLPKGSVDSFIQNTLTEAQLKEIGIYSLARVFENSDSGRQNFSQWLRYPNREFTVIGSIPDPADATKTTTGVINLPKTTYASILGVTSDDAYLILGNTSENGTSGTFKRLGEKILVEAIKKSSIVQNAQNDFLASHPDLQTGIAQYEFYKERVDNIRSHIDSLRTKADQLRLAFQALEEQALSLQDKQKNSAILDQLVSAMNIDPGNSNSAILTLAQQIISQTDAASSLETQLYEIVNSHVNVPLSNLRTALNSFDAELEYVAKNAYEIATGKVQSGFNLKDLRVDQLGFSQMQLAGSSVSVMEIVLLLTKKITPTDFFISIGSAKIADELNLPPKALKYAAKMVRAAIEKKGNSKTAFFRAIGLASLELKINQQDSSQVADFSDDAADVGEASTITELRDKLAKSFDGNTDRANTVIVSGFGLQGYSLEALMRGDFGAWASARPKAEANDKSLGLPTGTTENFIRGTSLKGAVQIGISDDNYREFSTKLGISEASLRLFIAKANGEDNPAVNTIYYVDRNRYTTTNDTVDICSGKPVPDNVFMYYDQDGMHYFNSYPEANEYVKAHQDKKFGDYISEIATRLSAVLASDPGFSVSGTSIDEIQTALQKFISGGANSVFSDNAINNSIKTFLESVKDIPSDLSEKFLSRSSIEGTIPENGKIDFLKTVGISLLKNFATSYLGQSLGLSIGSTRITADDVYEIFSGNSRNVFYRIGGAMLDQEIGLQKGTFESIISASSKDSRKCALDRAATQLLGKYLDIPGLRLEGSLFNNLGGGRVEQLLGFPEGSFRGASISELISTNRKDYVPIISFFKAFSLPVPKALDDTADVTLNALGKDYFDRYKGRSFFEKAEVINNYIEALGTSLFDASPIIWQGWAKIDMHLNMILTYLLKPAFVNEADMSKQAQYLKANESYSSYSDDELTTIARAFNTRLQSIDSALEMQEGQTAKLLLDQISPDNYRQTSSRLVIEDISVEVLKKVFGIESDIDAGDLRNFKSAILAEDPHQSQNERLSVIYTFFTKTFGLKFDEKAGFSPGTIAAVIADPSLAPALLMQAGAKMLDSQLGLEDKPYAFSKFAAIYLAAPAAEDVEYCNSASVMATMTVDACLKQRRFQNVEAHAKEIVKERVANELQSFLTKISGVDVDVTVNTPYGSYSSTEHMYGIVIPLEYLDDVCKGDLRILGVMATVRGLGAVLGDDKGNYALGADSDGFRFNWQDIVTAFYGDPNTELYASQKAREEVFAENNGANTSLYQNFAQDSEETFNIPWSGTASGVSNITAAADSAAGSVAYADINYAVPAGADISTPANPAATRPQLPMPETYLYPPGETVTPEEGWEAYNAAYRQYMADTNKWMMQNDNYQRIMTEADRAASEAVARDRDLKRELLEYRVSDCMLKKLDNKIPVGFTWAMLKGNGYVRTAALLNYMENWLRQDAEWAKYLPQGSLVAIMDFFRGPAELKGNIDALIDRTSAGIFGLIDNYLVEHSPKVFGLAFKQGTAQALFAFAKTGKYNQAVKIGGIEYSLATVYKDWTAEFIGERIGGWVDTKLGLPAGSSYGLYKSFTTFKDTQRLLRMASSLTTNADGLYNVSGSLAQSAGIQGSGVIDQAQLDKMKANFQQKMTDVKAEMVTMVITMLFSKQIASVEQSLGLVPGTGAIAVGMIVNLLMGASFNPVGAILFVAINLFGVYKVDILCTADGYYPEKTAEISGSVLDNGSLGLFDGMNSKSREDGYIKAAQYKADQLAVDLYEMPGRTNQANLVPLQVMVGRDETVAKAKPLLLNTVCKKVGSAGFEKNANGEELGICSGTYAGIWKNNPAYHHIGF